LATGPEAVLSLAENASAIPLKIAAREMFEYGSGVAEITSVAVDQFREGHSSPNAAGCAPRNRIRLPLFIASSFVAV
jgi:hypothetical protein